MATKTVELVWHVGVVEYIETQLDFLTLAGWNRDGGTCVKTVTVEVSADEAMQEAALAQVTRELNIEIVARDAVRIPVSDMQDYGFWFWSMSLDRAYPPKRD